MAILTFPTIKRISGPWLVSHDDLMSLDKIIEDQWASFLQYKDRKLDELAEIRIEKIGKNNNDPEFKDIIKSQIADSYSFSNDEKSIVTVFKSGKRLSTRTIKEAVSERSIQDEIISSLNIKLKCGQVYAAMNIGNNLEFNVEPYDAEPVNDCYMQFDRWVEKVAPSKWLSVWRNFFGLHWILLVLIVFFMLMALPDNTKAYKSSLINKSHELIEKGITSTNSNEALSILLSLQTEYLPNQWTQKNPKIYYQFLVYLAALFSVAISLSICPTLEIAITDRSKKRLRYWNCWLKLISRIIPALIVTGIFLPLVYDKLKIIFS